ncbi:hypothetical protein CLOM_g5621 [Closterium sp. NIES-68]|nr:hypothetical protein CLOM_g5621 [Closterium sp. NIES-68]
MDAHRYRQNYYWPHMADDVQKFVTSCTTCQRMKSSKQKRRVLQPLPVPEQPWQVVSLDFITGLPTTTAVMTRSLSSLTSSPKWDTSSRHTRQHAPRRQHNSLFVHHLTTWHSNHTHSDRDPKFTSKFWKELMSLLGPNSPCHPPTIRRQTDRPSASTKLWQLLAQPARTTSPNGTCTARPGVCYNNATHAATGQTPFFLSTWKIHNAFHVQLLKPYRDPNTIFVGRQPPPPPPVLVQNEPEYEVESGDSIF